ncbi:MAG TPA: hypothetical protein VK531_06855 [Gemmatimonadales bacterium]|nr:hypothetical protein [Gemmatimonadales bacterium]
MNRLALTTLAGVLGVGMLVASPDTAAAQMKAEPISGYRMHPDTSAALLHEPPGGAYKKVSTLVPLPDFVPGLGTLYVDPATLPAGPFLAYDHQGNLVSSIYMIPLKDMNAQKAFSGLKVARERADHVDIVFNAGHPGVAEPHYHVIVWYVSPQRAAQLAK